jgi:hypothetical protein
MVTRRTASMGKRRRLAVARGIITGAALALSLDACASQGDASVATLASVAVDTMGAEPTAVRRIRVQARRELVENSGVTLSGTQSGIFFTINDSGNEPVVFALDTTGADRGVWRVGRARNTDWEAISTGACAPAPANRTECLYIGDVGDNGADRRYRVIYRIAEPPAQNVGFTGSVDADSVAYRYADGPHDVEAMYVAPNGSAFLITKRPLRDPDKNRRQALVFELPHNVWRDAGTLTTAALVDSLPIVPGSGSRRLITDAALSPNGRLLAVRTYTQIFVFVTDSATGRVDHRTPPAVCNLAPLGRSQGEGIAWYGRDDRLVVSSEGRTSPMFAFDCPMPAAQ